MVFAGLFSALVKQEAAAVTRTEVIVTAEGDAQVSTSVKKFGTGSAALDGVGDYLKISAAQNSLFRFTGDFTIEFWIYSNAWISNNGMISNWSSAFIIWKPNSTNGIRARINNTAVDINVTISSNWSANQWYHIALVRSSGTVALFVDGTQVGSKTGFTDTVDWGTPSDGLDEFTGIGVNVNNNNPTWHHNGYFDEIRFSSSARYTPGTNFTPPTAAFTNDSDTVMLLHCDGANGSTSFLDDYT